jgi:MFS family permease
MMEGSVTGAGGGGWRVLFGRRHAMYLATFSLGSALYAFSAFLVSACLPSAVVELGDLSLMSWGFTFYLVAAILAGTLAATLKQRWGTQAAFQYASVVYLLGSLACGLAPAMWVLLGGRLLQGVGEGAISGLCYILIPEFFPAALIPAIFGVEAVIWALGSIVGPVVGGFLTEVISWRGAFLVSVPFILLFMAMVRIAIPSGGGGGRASAMPLPFVRLAGVGLGILLISAAAIAPPALRFAGVGAGLLVLLAMVLWDHRAANHLLPRGAFSFGSVLGLAFWIVLLMPSAHTGPGVYVILLFERVWGFSPLPASTLGATMGFTWSVVGVAVSWLSARWARACLWLGPLIMTAGLAICGVSLWQHGLLLFLAGQALVGLAYGVSWGFVSQAIMIGVAPADRDRASGMVPTMMSAGLAVGAALGGVAANSAGLAVSDTPAVVTHAGIWCFTLATAIALGAFLISLRLRVRMGD